MKHEINGVEITEGMVDAINVMQQQGQAFPAMVENQITLLLNKREDLDIPDKELLEMVSGLNWLKQLVNQLTVISSK